MHSPVTNPPCTPWFPLATLASVPCYVFSTLRFSATMEIEDTFYRTDVSDGYSYDPDQETGWSRNNACLEDKWTTNRRQGFYLIGDFFPLVSYFRYIFVKYNFPSSNFPQMWRKLLQKASSSKKPSVTRPCLPYVFPNVRMNFIPACIFRQVTIQTRGHTLVAKSLPLHFHSTCLLPPK